MSGSAGAWSSYGPWFLGATIGLLAAFYLLRGRVRIERGWAGFSILRFGALARLVHWLLAISFVFLALTGLALRHATALLEPVAGAQSIAQLLAASRAVHGAAALSFMAALLAAFPLWVGQCLPHWRDAVWLLKGGGILIRGVHPPAWRFNAGQKLLFWLVMVAGAVLSVTGIALLLPWTGAFAGVVSVAAKIGIGVSVELSPDEEARESRAWHILAAYFIISVVVVHVYLRTLGIQGAFSAMGSGQVDANWARQHHRLWAEREIDRKMQDAPHAARAETAPAA